MGKIAGLWGGNAGILLGFAAAGAVLFGGYLYLADAVDQPENVAEPVAQTAPEAVVEAEPQSEPSDAEPAPTPSDSTDTATAPEQEPEPSDPALAATSAEVSDQVAEPSEQLAALEPANEPTEPELAPTPSEPAEIAAPAEPIAPAADIPAPRFDLVRVEQDGTTLIAGKASPDTEIVIVMDGEELGRVTSDGSGAFVSFLSIPNSQDARVLSLVARHATGEVTSEEQVILAPSPAPVVVASNTGPLSEEEAEPEVVASAEEPSGNIDTASKEPAPVAEEATPDTPAITQEGTAVPEPQEPTVLAAVEPPQPAPEVLSEATLAPAIVPQPNPVTVLRADADGVEVLQPAVSDTAPEVTTSVALDAISYSDIGDVSLSGRAPDQGSVRVYLDNAPIATLEVDETGRWRGDLPQVETGVYTLRIDQIDASGAVTSRVETPFKREEPAVLSAALAQAGKSGAQVRAVTVQTGATLWAIARDRYGDGTLYVRVFDANRDSIRDPHLIYPGQVFALPE